MCQVKWKILNLYLLLDSIFLAQIASSFGFEGFLLVIYNAYWYQIITLMAFPIQILFFVGNFRILMLTVKWSKWKVILFKLVLLTDSAAFFQIGAYYMSVNHRYTNGSDSQLDGKVKDFVLFYIFGLFALFVEMYVKICEIDQTNQLRFDYELKQMQELKRIQKIRKSVINLNLQEIHRDGQAEVKNSQKCCIWKCKISLNDYFQIFTSTFFQSYYLLVLLHFSRQSRKLKDRIKTERNLF